MSNNIEWSTVNGYLNIPNFRNEIWKKIPDEAHIISFQYRNQNKDPVDIQIGMTGT